MNELGIRACIAGQSPLILSLPHVARALPAAIAARLSESARRVPDTDWHVEQLYAFARERGVSWLEAGVSRYVIDLNRPPDDASLYPGQAGSGLCPIEDFDGQPLYVGPGPSSDDVAARRAAYWEPYHRALATLIKHVQARWGYAVLLDAHSIRSVVPRLFPGRLPDINIGMHSGRSCAPTLRAALETLLQREPRFTHVFDGRFKGGYITRQYGAPDLGVHALQIELAQCAYLDERSPERFEAGRAAPLQSVLASIVELLLTWRPG